MTDEEIKELCNELDATWERYHSYAALTRVMSGKKESITFHQEERISYK